MKAFLKSGSFWFIVLAMLFLVAGIVVSKEWWGWLHPELSTTVSNSETLRNVGLLIGGVLAFIFAGWRAWVAERQANASQLQAETAQRQIEIVQAQVEVSQNQITIAQSQAETAQLSLLNERYQRGAEMLGNGNLVVRMGGIGALKRLADQHPEHYHIQVTELLCAFVRHPTMDQDANRQGKLREDVQAIITAIGARSELGLGIEEKADYTLDLREADLSFARLSGANLARANLSYAKLHHANFFDWPYLRPDLAEPIPSGPDQPQIRIKIDMEPVTPELTGLDGLRADLSLANLWGADLSEARLVGTNLSGAELSEANLRNIQIMYSNLKVVIFYGADLSDAFILDSDLSGARLAHATLARSRMPSTKLYGANLFGVSLDETDLSGAVLSMEDGKYVVTGLTQKQLDESVINSSNAPDLTGVLEVGSGKQLAWNNRTPGEGS